MITKSFLLRSALKTLRFALLSVATVVCSNLGFANTAADGSGAGPDVTVTDNGDDTVTMSNGIASIVVVKKTGRLNSVSYTYSNDGTTKTCETLSGKGQYYYGGFRLGNGIFEYSLATAPPAWAVSLPM